ncbi:ribonuclease H-like protein [Durotheca rogersii]|uniref:ribonuclease H-like protein n=1 Tax=Durotheca rogersii TaxID=419775 RepID=UPI00221EEEA9|nr:ribonuclease H-like protein [Durotheca rogersii]KAI5865527.1 ribonuclease H-like protein [Durotheca rogersii]
MMLLGTLGAAGSALRPPEILCAPFALCSLASRRPRIGFTLPKYQLWHPRRCVSFSPTTAQSPDIIAQHVQAFNGTITKTTKRRKAVSAQPSGDVGATSLPPKSSKKARPSKADRGKADGTANKRSALSEIWVSDKPPVSVLPYKMKDDLFYAAKNAPAGSPDSFWSYSQYRGIGKDGRETTPLVHYCRTRETMESVCKQYFLGESLLGFDLEWCINSMRFQGVRRNVSLIQLASPCRIGLFHVACFRGTGDMVGPSFRKIMEDANITKVGVAIRGDVSRLRKFLDIDSKGLIELSHLYRLVTHSASGDFHLINKKLVPLATQVQQYLRLPLFKGQDVRSSNWMRPLNMAQIKYSASDAYAGLHLYATLEYFRKKLHPRPPTPHHAELGLPIRLADSTELTVEDDDADTIEKTELEHVDVVPPPLAKPLPQKTKATGSSRTPKDSRVEIAEERATRYRAANPNAQASIAQLRAYYMWHEQGLDVQTIAGLLRSPPQRLTTVVYNIVNASRLEGLPIDSDRTREEINSLGTKKNELASQLSS